MMKRKALIAILGFAFAAIAGPPLGAGAAEPVALRIGAMPIDTAAEVYYARNMGFFKAAGLDVTLTVLNNGAAIIPAVTSGSLDVGFGSANSVIQARERGLAVRFIAPASQYNGPPSAAALMVLKDSPIRNAADLNGKIVAVDALRNLTGLSIAAWIDKGGGNSSSVQFIEMPYAQMGVALTQGRVAAAGLVEPFVTANKTDARILGDLNGAIAPKYLLAGWFATDDWLRRNSDTARRFITVMQKTARWANTHRRESAKMLADYSKIAPEVIDTMARARYDESAGVAPASVAPVIELMMKYGRLKAMDASDLVWQPGTP
jgi:NitT/TauT family transport system substrate-binding protein